MFVDVDAAVLGNTRLSEDYNVVALGAPEIAARVQPGQFVMVKPGLGYEPLLRRPFSVFEILRDDAGRAHRALDPEQAHRRRDALVLRPRARTAIALPGAARAPVLAAGRRPGGVAGRRRGRAGTVCDDGGSADRAQRSSRPLLRRAPRPGPALRRVVRRARPRGGHRHRGRQRRRRAASSPRRSRQGWPPWRRPRPLPSTPVGRHR